MYVQKERSKGIDDDISAALLLSAHQYHRLDESLYLAFSHYSSKQTDQ